MGESVPETDGVPFGRYRPVFPCLQTVRPAAHPSVLDGPNEAVLRGKTPMWFVGAVWVSSSNNRTGGGPVGQQTKRNNARSVVV